MQVKEREKERHKVKKSPPPLDQQPITAQKRDVTKDGKILKYFDFFSNAMDHEELRMKGRTETHWKGSRV